MVLVIKKGSTINYQERKRKNIILSRLTQTIYVYCKFEVCKKGIG